MVGQTISRYRVLRKLGGGGMGEVYEAVDESLGRHVAIKFLSGARARSHESVLRFEREARAASALNHPHICTIHDFGLSDSQPYIVMELLDGQTLRDRLRSGPLDTHVLADLGCEVADALQAAHSAGIIHRDITPSNIFVTRSGHAKILDFGLAKLTADKDASQTAGTGEADETHQDFLTSPGAALGTVAYMSPEQARADPIDHRTDLFSFGCVLYEMATGRRAFQGRTSAVVFEAILHTTPEAPRAVNPALPDDLDRLILKAVEKDPDLRYQTAREIRTDLLRMTRGGGSGIVDRPVLQSGGDRQGTHRSAGSVTPAPPPRPARAGFLRRAVPWMILIAVAGAAAGYEWSRATSTEPFWASPQQLTTEVAAHLEPALSPDGTMVAFTNRQAGASSIWLFDIRGRVSKKLTQNGRSERSPAWNAADSMVYFVAEHQGRPAVWKAPRWPGSSPTLVIEGADEPDVSLDGARLAFVRPNATGANRIWVASLPETGDAHPVTGDGPEFGKWEHREPAWSPDGQRICYRGQRDLFIVRVAQTGIGAPTRLTKDDARDEDPAWSPDGRFVFFASTRDNTTALWSVPASGGAAKRLTLGVGPESHPTLSGEGDTLVYTAALDDPNIVIHDLQTGAERVIQSSRDDEMPALLPGLKGVVFVSNRLDGFRLWLQAIDAGRETGEARMLTEQPGTVANPAVSPDGLWVAYYRVFGGQRNIWTVPIDGGPARPFTNNSATDVHPAWSPDGSRIAFVSDRSAGVNQVFVAGVKEGRPVGTPVPITGGSRSCWSPSWSPDGMRIAFVSPDGGEVFVAPSDGRGTARQLTRGAMARRIRWSHATNTLFVSGGWGLETRLAVKEVSPDGGAVREILPPVSFGEDLSLYDFDISSDGRWLALSREEVKGNLCSLTARGGRK